MHTDDQNFFVIGAVKDSDPALFGRSRVVRQRKIVSHRAGMFKTEYLAALGINPRHHMLDGTILSRRVHGLKDQQDGIAVGGVKKLLLRAQLSNMLS